MTDLKNQIIKRFNIEDLTAQILLDIGFTSIEECEKFLYSEKTQLVDVNLYKGFLEVKERIIQAINDNEKVVIYGDYDCDGVCASAILFLYLRSKGLDVNYYIPNRHEHGYGMNIESLEEICEMYYPDLLITVDCGITSTKEVEYIHEALGFDVVITDHHKPQEELPDCPIFNPHLTEGVFNNLCGAGVVLRLIEGIDGINESLKYYDIATIATIADLVPLVEDNRKIVKIGLEQINKGYRKGLRMLIDSANIQTITSNDIAFRIAPRINAAGRLDSADKVVALFFEEDHFVVKSLVEELNELNKKRQDLTNKIASFVEESLGDYDFENNPVIVLKDDNWEEGVIGIVAAKIVTDYHRPVILFTYADGQYKGSGRSIPNVDLFECVSYAKDLLTKFGGHKQACGLSVTKENFDAFKQKLNEYVTEHYLHEIDKKPDKFAYDFHDIKNLLKQTKELEMLEPFGEKNKKPLFSVKLKEIGFKKLKVTSEHLVYNTSNFQLLAFYQAKNLGVLNSNIEKEIYFNLNLNFYNNKYTPQGLLDSFDCVDVSNNMQVNYLESALYPDESIFKPKCIHFDEAVALSQNSAYYTAYICYNKDTYTKALEKLKDIKINLYNVTNKSPKNAIFYALNIEEDLTKYKKVVFLDRPITLGVIDVLKLNKDCEVFYVENVVALKDIKKDLPDYTTLGKIYVQMVNDIAFKVGIDLDSLYMDIEKTLNVNYNSFVVALYIFLDLGLIEKMGNSFKVNRNVKNPITNSQLYNKLLGV